MSRNVEAVDLRRRVAEQPQWYHTIELSPGVVTPGWFDLRELGASMPLPRSLEGKRCLDVGTFDGFWAFEMEKRGARETVAIDVLDPRRWDWPADRDEATVAALAERKRSGEGFEVARDALRSSVERREMSVYDLDPELVGHFDVVYFGSLLLHLRDPVGALERVRSVCKERVIVCDAISAKLTLLYPRTPVAHLDGRGRPWWWKPNLAGLRRMVESAGFALSEEPRQIRMRPGRGYLRPSLRPRTLMSAHGRAEMLNARLGDPHGVVVATPRDLSQSASASSLEAGPK